MRQRKIIEWVKKNYKSGAPSRLANSSFRVTFPLSVRQSEALELGGICDFKRHIAARNAIDCTNYTFFLVL